MGTVCRETVAGAGRTTAGVSIVTVAVTSMFALAKGDLKKTVNELLAPAASPAIVKTLPDREHGAEQPNESAKGAAPPVSVTLNGLVLGIAVEPSFLTVIRYWA